MKFRCSTAALLAAALLCQASLAQPASPAPAFDVGYRAWEVVTEIARHNRAPGIAGDCGKTFRPFVIPGLKRQTKPQEDLAAAACYDTARAVCANGRLQRTPELARKCEEFR